MNFAMKGNPPLDRTIQGATTVKSKFHVSGTHFVDNGRAKEDRHTIQAILERS